MVGVLIVGPDVYWLVLLAAYLAGIFLFCPTMVQCTPNGVTFSLLINNKVTTHLI